MKRLVLPLAAVCVLYSGASLAAEQPLPRGQTLSEAQLTPVRDVLTASQQRLQELGYNVTPSGRFDAATRNSVLAFQADHGLRPTGDVDLTTIAALGVDVNTGAAGFPPGSQTAMVTESRADQIAEARFRDSPAYNQIMLNSDKSTAPQVRNQPEQFQVLGVPQPRVFIDRFGNVPGVPHGYPMEDLVR